MRLVSFRREGRASYGIADAAGIYDLGARIGSLLPDLQSYLAASALGLLPSSRSGPTPADYGPDEVAYEPVIATPRKIICVGLNYEEHRVETGRAKSAYPSLFTRFADTLVGHRQPIRRPLVSEALDYEGELAVVIGRDAYRVSRERAVEFVAGYACFNDATVRDWQRHTHQFTPGKNFPATGGFGPELVTPDEVGRLEDLALETRLNGRVVQAARLGEMIFPVADVIAYTTTFTRLAPGDVIVTGTPGGVGFKRDPPRFMRAGDRVEVVIERIGHLVNEVVDEPSGPP